MHPGSSQEAQDELTDLMTVMYMLIQHAVSFPEDLEDLYSSLSPSPYTLAPVTQTLTP